ncbi:hypothetical protein CAPTEDRAFT_216195 [Capitella teleta]|uniref:Uncharacterized protein n=1 Tax=Capitella teleta TaxID=283909 RepID=R7V4G5_CAPTE|nr:hypothetical protein CAPTEDRAFT_216195 [Capitella teleta]|eukprot:ELU13469.1 hypothetical protein CAPTEDRAFT_216195 [Capitella teleta]
MLSRIAAIEPSTPTPVVVPADIPDVWVTDRIDLHDLARRQKEQFCDAYVEASQETDESPYIVQGSLIFTMAEPSRNAGRYLRLLLPQQFRQQVIDRCHADVGHAAFLKTLAREEGERLQAIRLAERILREYRSKQKETYRENEPSRAKRLPPGTFVSVRILNPKKGETRWQPGYQVISSYGGALRVIELDTGNVVRINQRNVREIPESKPYDEINPHPPLKTQTTFDYVSSEAKPIPVVEESYLPTLIPRGPKRPSNDQPNLATPSVPVSAVSAALAPSIVFPSDDWSSCDDTDGHTYREDHDDVDDRDDSDGYDDQDDHDNPDDQDVPDDHDDHDDHDNPDDHDDHDDPDGHTDRNYHDDSRDDSLDKEPDLRAARARDCFHLPRGNQRILRGQKANVQLANTGGQKFAENKEPESKRIHHCQIATTWKAPIFCTVYEKHRLPHIHASSI